MDSEKAKKLFRISDSRNFPKGKSGSLLTYFGDTVLLLQKEHG